ncbi:MAG: zinc metallopeptidase [Bradymonadales bacterium]|nr:zinc metallopeptidase [Bradymonadales bacterium]
MFRQAVAPAAALGSHLFWIFLILGFVLQSSGLLCSGLFAFSLAVAFTLPTLPIELDASARAKRVLEEMGLVSVSQGGGVETDGVNGFQTAFSGAMSASSGGPSRAGTQRLL